MLSIFDLWFLVGYYEEYVRQPNLTSLSLHPYCPGKGQMARRLAAPIVALATLEPDHLTHLGHGNITSVTRKCVPVEQAAQIPECPV